MALGSLRANLSKMADNARDVSIDFNTDLDEMMIDAAAKGDAFMRANAPWDDNDGNRHRTPGAAREGLFTVPVLDGDHKEILFSHGVNYGIWLEISHNGRYEIIMPSVKAVGDALMASLAGALNIRRRRIIGSPTDALHAEQAARAEQRAAA